MMRTVLLTGAAVAALALVSTAAVRAETVYIAGMDAAVAPAPGYVYAPEPNYVVQERTYVPDRSYVVVAPPRERVIVVPRREVVVEPRTYVAPVAPTVGTGGYYSTAYSTGSCMIDANGFERCY